MWRPTFPATFLNNQVDKASLFAVQVWHELLSPGSPDSYQARTLDLCLVLDDMAHVANVIRDSPSWKTYLSMLLDELSEQIDMEQRLVRADAKLENALNLVKSQANAALSLSDTKLAHALYDLQSKIDIAKAMLGTPQKRLIADAIELVEKPGALRKEALVHRLSTIATHVQYQGAGDEALKSIDEKLLFERPGEAIKKLTVAITQPETEWECFLGVEGRRADIIATADAASFQARKSSDLSPGDAAAKEWLETHQNLTHIVVKTFARSSRVAAGSATSKLAQVLDIHNLYKNSPDFSVSPSVLVRQANYPAIKVQVTPGEHFGLFPRSEHRALTKDRIRKLGTRLSGRLANALECHRLAISAGDPRTAIINLWTALETISGPTGPGAIGHRVAHKVAPIVAWRRVDKMVTYLAMNCHQTRDFLGTRYEARILTKSGLNKTSVDDLLGALASPRENASIEEFFRVTGCSPLLAYRLHEAWKQFHSPNELRSRLEKSKRRVEWQIFRLYRARNLLVHRGEESHLIWRLLQNAQFYVSLVLGRVMNDLSLYPSWTIDTSLDHHAAHFDFICKSLGSNKVPLTYSDFLSSKSSMPNDLLWP